MKDHLGQNIDSSVQRPRSSQKLSRFFQAYKARRELRRRGQSVQVDVTQVRDTLCELEKLQGKMEVEEYYRILSSYEPEKWSGVPWPLNPLEFAIEGWSCCAPATVRCPVCQTTFSFDMFSYYEVFRGVSKTDQTMRAWMIKEFRAKLTDPGHGELCTQRNPLCRPSQINQFAVFSIPSFRDLFVHRLKSVLTLQSKIPVIMARYYAKLNGFQKDTLLDTVTHLTGMITSETSAFPNAVVLAIYGWEFVAEKEPVKYLHCQECQRRVDLSTFCTLDRLHVLEENETSGFCPGLFSSSARVEEYRMDCEKEHFSWCPWVRPVALSEDTCAMLSLKNDDKLTGADLTYAAFEKHVLRACENNQTVLHIDSFEDEATRLQTRVAAAKIELRNLQKFLSRFDQ